MSKKLSLKKETLAELTTDQLRVVHGAAGSDSCTSCVCSCVQYSCMDVSAIVRDLVSTTGQFIDANCG